MNPTHLMLLLIAIYTVVGVSVGILCMSWDICWLRADAVSKWQASESDLDRR